MRIDRAADKITRTKFAAGPAKRHPGGAARVALLPRGIERRAGPPDHPVRRHVGKDGDNHKPDRLAADVRQRIERYLARLKSGGIAAQVRDKGMRPFVAGGREKKNDVPDKSQCEEIRSHQAIDYFLAAGSARESVGGIGSVPGNACFTGG